MPRKKPASPKNKPKARKKASQEGTPHAPVTLTDDLLHLAFAYISLLPSTNYNRNKLLMHVRAMQRLAGVNSQWRAIAVPLFYRTIVADFDEAGYKTMVQSFGGSKGVRTNIGLFHGLALAHLARGMVVVVQGSYQAPVHYMQALLHAGFGGVSWLRVERLCIDINSSKFATTAATFRESGDEDEKVVKKLLSLCLPSLREIHTSGNISGNIMFGAPIGHLISERFYGPTPLRALSIVNFGFPNRETLYQYQTVAPIAIVCLYINHFDCTPSLQLPPVLAGSLVEVSLKPVVPKRVWDPFVADGLQGSPGDKLVFFRLQSLLLGFLDESLLISGAGVDGRIQEIDSSMLPYDGTPRFMRSATVGSLAFPQLTSLEIRHFCLELADFLSIFAASPISKLALVLSDSSLPFNGDLLEFTGLHSFAVQIPRISGLSDMLPVLSCLSRMFVAVSPHLQSQTIELSICRGYKFGALDAGSFKESLVSLTLKCQIKPEELDVVLGGYPNLKKLYLHSAVSQPISSTPSLVNMLRSLCAGAIRAPVCQHLRFLSAQNLRHYKYSSLPSSASIKPATVATEVALYRGLLRSLVCRLPLLVTFQVSATAFDGIYKCINVLVQVLLQSIKAFFGT